MGLAEWSIELARVVFNQLSARKVATVTKPGRYTDGLGLNLFVDKAGNKRWELRLAIAGKRRDIGLGSAREVSLAEARDRRDEIRKALREGRDPLAERARVKTMPFFQDYATALYEAIKGDFKNEKHTAQWISSLRLYAFPSLGNMPLNTIDGQAVKGTLETIWTAKAETARRVKQRISRVMDAAIAEGLHAGPNPVLGATASLSKRRTKGEGFKAMPYREVPAFVQRLHKSQMHPSSRRALAFLILTASRTSEVLGALWSEIDLKRKLWTVPEERIKAGREHQVPLSDAALALLKEQRCEQPDSKLMFPNDSGAQFSNMVFLAQMRRWDLPFTTHGFRSSFRDWSEEQTNYSYASKEAALAHVVTSKVEAAYRRTTLLDERRELMADWAAYVIGERDAT